MLLPPFPLPIKNEHPKQIDRWVPEVPIGDVESDRVSRGTKEEETGPLVDLARLLFIPSPPTGARGQGQSKVDERNAARRRFGVSLADDRETRSE